MSSNDEELKTRAHCDLTNRARGGIVIYMLAWLLIMLPNQVHDGNPEFFFLNTAILLLVLLTRLGHYYAFVRKLDIPISVANNWLVFTILVGALHWGLMSCWILLHSSYASFEIYIVVTAVVLGVSGTTALSISNRIRILFPVFLMVPSILVLTMRAATGDLLFAAMAVLSMIYAFFTSKTASNDYWQANRNRALAEQRAEAMEQLSITDQLTQLYNRSYFDQQFSLEWKRGERHQRALSLLILDLDHFKRLNDTHGHLFGDDCLKRVAQILNLETHRETDVVARYGGEEFVLLLPDTDALQAEVVAERLRLAIEAADIRHDGEKVRLSCSIGGATAYPVGKENRENLLRRADNALYKAKDNGRNRYQASVADDPVRAASIA